MKKYKFNLVLLIAMLLQLVNIPNVTIAQTTPSFDAYGVVGVSLNNPTSLDIGPDGRLYVSQQNGMLYAYEIERTATPSYEVVSTEAINLVQNIPNHNDDGTNSSQNNRQVTGLVAAGTATNPVLYVSSSDPRISVDADSGLDTNSGIISRLTWNGTSWDKVDIVRGLPRSEENHSTNGMDLDETSNILYVAQGGHTNKGAPASNFAGTPEYYLAGAILSVDLTAIESMTVWTDQRTGDQFIYDLPTLDDPERPNITNADPDFPYPSGHPLYGESIDPGDPFGGNNGSNMAVVGTSDLVQVYAPGFRNAYDVLFTTFGELYTYDNGPNTGWGGLPVTYDSAGVEKDNSLYDPSAGDYCTNEFNEDGSSGHADTLHHIASAGYYGGHPAPIRAFPDQAGIYIYEESGGTWTETANYTLTDNLPSYLTDFDATPNTVECEYDILSKALADVGASTNGLAEYTASNFEGAMQGDLLAASFDGNIYRYQLNSAGDAVTSEEAIFGGFGSTPLDVTTQGDSEIFPGTVWAATYGSDDITVFEPADFGTCSGEYDATLDEDGDGYDNADEIDNGTDPCSAGSQPSDFDDDGTSDLNDPDDDNDGIPDTEDAFAFDPDNGTMTQLPIDYPFWNDDPGTGFFGLGFTGLMTNGEDYLNLYDPTTIAAGGASGKMTVEQVSAGDAYQTNNTQENGFQFGIDVDANDRPFIIHTNLESPFFDGDATPEDYQSFGLFIGDGSQANYLKVVMNANGGVGGIEVGLEVADSADNTSYGNAVWGGAEILLASSVDLYLEVDPQSLTAQPRVSLDGGTTLSDLGSPITIPADWLDPNDDMGMAVGIISTSFNSGETFAATWDFINIDYVSTDAEAFVGVTLDEGINASSYSSGSFEITNQSPTQDLLSVTIDLSDSLLPDIVFDPDGTAGDTTSKCLVIDSGAADTGYVAPTDNCVDPFSSPHQNGYYEVTLEFTDFNPGETMTFSVDVDPTSIQGSSAPGPGDSGSVSGLELTGSAVSVEFSDLATFVSDLYRQPLNDSGGQVTLNDQLPAAPVINIEGLATPVTTNDPNQNVTISGPANAEVALLVAEAAFFEPSGGAFDPDPYEGNSVVNVNEYTATLDADGLAMIAVTLTNTDPTATDTYGLNYMAAVVVESDGDTGPTSNVEVIEYDPNYDPIEVLFRVNNGGPQIAAADASDPDWSEDQVTSGAGNAAVTGTPSPYVNSDEIEPHSYGVTNTITLDSSVPEAAPMELFQMERWDDATAPEMQWDFPIPEGTEVEIRLYLAEIFDGIDGAGQRVFDVSVEGTVPAEFDDLDPYGLGGGLYIGTMVSTTTTVIDGDNLDIDFIHITENPAIKGIEIIQLTPAPVVPSVTITSPSDGDVFFTDTVDVSWESSNLTAEVDHAHLYIDTEDYNDRISPLPLNHTHTIEDLTPGDHFVIVKLADQNHIEIEGAEDRIDFTVEEPGTPEALIQVNPGDGVFASTYSGGSFQIHNTGGADIVSLTIDLRTAWMMDVVFDPDGTAGDAAGKCLTPDSGSTATGFDDSGDLCTDPFSVFHNGTDPDDGYDVLTLNFTDFNPGESFTFSADLDPTSIKDATDTGDAGSISGFEIIGASVSVGFSGEIVIDSNLYDEGSLGGSAATLTSTEAPAPVIEMDGVTPPTTLSEADQTVLITGTPGANFSILQPVARLYIDDATPGGGYDIDPFESNEALAKSLYSGTFDGSGNASVPVTLFIEASPDAGPSAPLNHFIAVEENAEGDFGLTSNSFVVEFVPEQELICINAGGGDYPATDGQFFMADIYFTATTGGTYSVTEPISNTDDDPLFQTERYGDPFSYAIPVSDGDYTVDLMFVELYHGVSDASAAGDGVPGDRIFSVDLEGVTVLSEYDIIAEAGAPLTAITETFNTTVTDGEIDLTFYLGTNGVDNAKVSAICVTPANVPPTADAGEDQTVTDTDNSDVEDVTLDGSGSSDSDGSIVSYEWSWSMGGTTGVNPTVTLPVGEHIITLTVTDDAGDTDTDTVTITVNEPPTADAGPDQVVTDEDASGDEDVTLDGSGSSDNDGSIVSYSWSEGGSEIATGVNPTVTLSFGTHTITLTVTDDDGATDTDTVTITFNEPPIADAGEDQTVADADDSGDEDITLDSSGSSDSDGSIVSYSWNDGSGEIATGVNPTVMLPVGTHNITLTVTDNDGGMDTDTVTITITSFANEPPTADAGPDQTVSDLDENGEEDVVLDGSASNDSDGTIVSYSWSNGTDEIAAGESPTVTLAVGTHTITLTVTDDDGATDTDTVTIIVNEPPKAEADAIAGPDQKVIDEDDSGDEDITLDGSGSSDSDGSIVSYSWTLEGSEIATGVNPTVTLPVGTHIITLTVTDDIGATGTDTVTIIVEPAPTFNYFFPLFINMEP